MNSNHEAQVPLISVVGNQASPLRSICLILVSMFCFAVVDALGKSVAERLKRRDALAALAGFVGVLLVVRPSGSNTNWIGPVLLIAAAIFGALSNIQIKRIRSTDDSGTTVLFFTIVGTVITGASLLIAWRAPTLDALSLMALLGAFATAGQLHMTMAFRQADAAALAPYNYTSIVWAALFGYVIWGETIGTVSLVGITMIVGSSIAVALRGREAEGPMV